MSKRDYHPAMVARWEQAACAGKEAYSDGGKANQAASRVKRKGSKVMSYRCVHCGQWHIGSGR